MKNVLKKELIGLLILTQTLGAALPAYASLTAPSDTANTPEFNLLKNVITLQGENLSTDQMQTQINGTLSVYLSTAPLEGQQARLQDALVGLGIYTQAQATKFVNDAQASAQNVGSAKEMVSEITRLGNLHPTGAQFSGCDVGQVAMPALAIGIVTFLAGAILDSQNMCVDPHGEYPLCNGPDDHEPLAAKPLLITGGVLMGAAILAMLTLASDSGC